MVYGHTGSSWQPPMSVGMSNPTGHPDLTAIITGSPEESKHYEVGAKWSFMNGRGRLFVDYWRQKYDGAHLFCSGRSSFYHGRSNAGKPEWTDFIGWCVRQRAGEDQGFRHRSGAARYRSVGYQWYLELGGRKHLFGAGTL